MDLHLLERRGLFDKQTGQFTHYNTETVPGFASNHIWSAIDGGNGLLYIGHVDRGFSILSIKDKTVKNFTHEPQSPNSLPGNEVTCVYKDKSGNIWIGTDRGVVLFNPEAESFIPFDDKTNCISHRVYDIHQLDDNRLWIAMEFGGIAVVDLSQQLFRSSDQIHALLSGRETMNTACPTPVSVACSKIPSVMYGQVPGEAASTS